MRRAMKAFEHVEFSVLPAGTGFHTKSKLTAIDFLPSASGLMGSYTFMHEAIGLLWYGLKTELPQTRSDGLVAKRHKRRYGSVA